jgi:hypothetical protein
VTGWLLWGARLASRWRYISAFDLVLRAAAYACIACGAAAIITLVLYRFSEPEEPDGLFRAALRASRAAVWFAPSVILFTAYSPAAFFAAGLLVISATRLLAYEWRSAHPAGPDPAPAELFGRIQFPQPHFLRTAAPAMIASVSAQGAFAAVLLHKPLLAGMGFAMGLALATVMISSLRPPHPRRPQSLPRAVLGVLLTLVLAIGLTVGGVQLYGGGDGFGFGSGPGDTASAPQAPAKANRAGGDTDLPRFTPTEIGGGGGFAGVILWPEIKPYATLIAPMPQRADGLGTVDVRPMSIPFSGEYWMYRWPYVRPPRNSFFQHGSPAKLSFRTTDRRAMQMEARHRLEQLVALDCCSRIQLAILNADAFPGTITLELVLIDNELSGAPWVSLGRQPVASVPDVRKDPIPPVAETLSFAVPTTARIDAFDEFRILFVRERRRGDRSAKVAIDRFILVPRL